MKICPACSTNNDDSSDYCQNCGTPLEQAPNSPQLSAERSPAPNRRNLILAVVITGAVVTAALIAVLIAVLSGKGSSDTNNAVDPTSVPDIVTTDDEGVEAPTLQLKLLSDYLSKTPTHGHLDKEFYYTEFFDSALDLRLYDKGYLYYLNFGAYYSTGQVKNTDGSFTYTYVKDGSHTVTIRNGSDYAQVSYENIYTYGLRYDDNGNVISEPKIKQATTDQNNNNNTIIVPTTSPLPLPDNPNNGPVSRSCRHCYGTGDCPTCYGSGYVSNPYVLNSKNLCTDCGGLGKCSVCHGTGLQ